MYDSITGTVQVLRSILCFCLTSEHGGGRNTKDPPFLQYHYLGLNNFESSDDMLCPTTGPVSNILIQYGVLECVDRDTKNR